jgi:hypothetical protein
VRNGDHAMLFQIKEVKRLQRRLSGTGSNEDLLYAQLPGSPGCCIQAGSRVPRTRLCKIARLGKDSV